ncbi:MAG: hypothetical protein ABID09_08350 [Candidatus Omnitrophota bacterium]
MIMRRHIAAAFVMISLVTFFFGNAAQAIEIEQSAVERITQPQPLYIGSRIFSKEHSKVGYQVYYTYIGIEQGHLKIKYELYYHYDELVETEMLALPLGKNGEAMFITKPIAGETIATATRLKITVLDSYGRIGVDKIK